jgi:hypothetical protein
MVKFMLHQEADGRVQLRGLLLVRLQAVDDRRLPTVVQTHYQALAGLLGAVAHDGERERKNSRREEKSRTREEVDIPKEDRERDEEDGEKISGQETENERGW